MTQATNNNDWYEKPKPQEKPTPKWLILVLQALFYAIFSGFLIANALAVYNYIFPPPHQEIMATDYEIFALLLNSLLGGVVGLVFGFIPTAILLWLLPLIPKMQKLWQVAIIGIIVPITILYGFDILLKAKMNGILPLSQYLIVIVSGILVGLVVFKPDLKSYFAPKPKAE